MLKFKLKNHKNDNYFTSITQDGPPPNSWVASLWRKPGCISYFSVKINTTQISVWFCQWNLAIPTKDCLQRSVHNTNLILPYSYLLICKSRLTCSVQVPPIVCQGSNHLLCHLLSCRVHISRKRKSRAESRHSNVAHRCTHRQPTSRLKFYATLLNFFLCIIRS